MNNLSSQCWMIVPYPLRIRNVRLKFLLLTSMSSFCCFNIATFGQAANEDAYRNAMLSGQAQLDRSYQSIALADQKSEDAANVGKEACQTKSTALEARAKQINEESKGLAEEAKAFADKALNEFRSAETLEPGRPEPIFGEALVLLQLKDYCSAIKRIKSVEAAGYRTPETTFALGAAFVSSSGPGSKQFQDGIELLTKYIDQAKASGHPEAFINFKVANKVRDKAVEKPAKLLEKNQAKDKEPNRAECPVPGKAELPFTGSISSAIGYNDNVITLGSGLPLPQGTSQKGSLYNESSFALGRDFSLSHPSSSSSTGWLSDKLSLKYIFIADTFEDLPDRDRLLQTVSGSYQRAFTPKLGGLLKVSEQWLYIDQRLASNILSAQEAFALNLNSRSKTLVSYYLIRTDGFTASPPPNNPDGFTNRAELTQGWVFMQDKHDFSAILALTGQYAHEWDEPNGIAGRFQRDELLSKIEWKVFHARDQCSFVRAVTASLSERWQADRYSHATFRSPTSGSLFTRSDDTNLVVFAMNIPMWYDQYMENAGVPDANRMEANFEYRYTTRDSNVQAKAYDQNIFLVSLKINF